MENVSKGPTHQAYLLLRVVFVVAPILAGLDKFFDVLVDWDKYLVPWFGGFGPPLMLIAGVVEVIAGLGVFFKPKIFANIVGLWLVFIILNLIALGDYYDIALRDLGLCLSAFALGRLAKVCS
ncbi:MAG TPA: hypothetical protein VLF94_08030 [Chlamydiales bacterium]|nr:hypothetical protein [Chlamydiales bacterium]